MSLLCGKSLGNSWAHRLTTISACKSDRLSNPILKALCTEEKSNFQSNQSLKLFFVFFFKVIVYHKTAFLVKNKAGTPRHP